MMNYMRQKPNRKILGILRFHLQMHNLVDQAAEERAQQERIRKRAELNRKRKEKGKKPKKEEPGSFNQWLLSIGEKPVILDTFAAKKSAEQVELLLKNKGYFNARVEDSISYRQKRKRATIHYQLIAGTAYRIRNVQTTCDDPIMNLLIKNDFENSLIKTGEIFETENLDFERSRITELLRNEGYFNFNRSFISYSADTGVGNHEVDITLIVNNIIRKVPGYADSIEEQRHKRFLINDIYVVTDHQPQNRNRGELDTLLFNEYVFISEGMLNQKPKILKANFFINKGDFYRKSRVEYTYSRLMELRAFKFINIQFEQTEAESNLLNCYILLTPAAKQSITLETQGTNTSGNLGIAANINYGNRNLLKGIENFELRLTGALEAQPIINPADDATIRPYLPFNTIQAGPVMSLTIPKFIGPINLDEKRNIRTLITTGLNYQLRPDYSRSVFNVTYGYTWKRKQETHIFNPVELNYLRVGLSPSFQELLENLNNLFFLNAFKPQFIAAMRYSYIKTNQNPSKIQDYQYFRFNAESAGLLLNLTRNFYANPAQINDQFIVLGVPYSQYFRFDTDYRFFKALPQFQSFVFRGVVGVGLPYGNSTVMPFDKSFFGGGANGNRAWLIRTLGPGSYQNPSGVRIDQIGDIKLETSVEYRAKIYSYFESAIFIDAGNIWLMEDDIQRPGAVFDFSRFYKEFGVGGGLGLRLNFNFFILRLDAAHPLHDPSMDEGSRWRFNHLELRRVNFNFAIGYPF
ncbi:MAG: BamA/TamA family outer membrane protein [Flavobacteriales bacterium]